MKEGCISTPICYYCNKPLQGESVVHTTCLKQRQREIEIWGLEFAFELLKEKGIIPKDTTLVIKETEQ